MQGCWTVSLLNRHINRHTHTHTLTHAHTQTHMNENIYKIKDTNKHWKFPAVVCQLRQWKWRVLSKDQRKGEHANSCSQTNINTIILTIMPLLLHQHMKQTHDIILLAQLRGSRNHEHTLICRVQSQLQSWLFVYWCLNAPSPKRQIFARSLLTTRIT